MRDPIRVLVLSDLHAVHDEESRRAGPAMNYALGSAPRGLLSLCRDALLDKYPEGIDLVLVAGDITDKANGGPLQLVWTDLHWFADSLSAPLVATSGNHDYDSRASDDPLPYKSLLSLTPTFPFGDESVRNKYFAEHHAVFQNENVIVVTANSAAHHGYVVAGEPEHTHGRFTSALPEMVLRSLAGVADDDRVRILLTHHHLNQLPNFDAEEKSASIGHEAVIRGLGDHGDWLVVHGHKHRGWVQYASGGGDSPPLISASSFSADLGGGSFEEKVRHQFHVIEFTRAGDESDDLTGARGAITSWTHSPLGWRIAGSSDDLPGLSGFGWKTSLRALAERLREHLVGARVLNADELAQFEPRARYLTFDDLRRLAVLLESGIPAVKVRVDDVGTIEELTLGTKVIT